jgi:hypothetical protein
VVRHREYGVATLVIDGLSNALVESTNTTLRLLTLTPYGFRCTAGLIALNLPDRAATTHLWQAIKWSIDRLTDSSHARLLSIGGLMAPPQAGLWKQCDGRPSCPVLWELGSAIPPAT